MARPKIDQIANLQTQLTSTSDSANNRVLKTGDTMTGQLNVSSGGLIVQSNDSDRAAFIRSPTRTLRITPYYNSEGNDKGTWLEAINTSNAAYNKFTLSGSNIILEPTANVGIGNTAPGSKLTVAGTVESTSGGIKFPDGTTQTTAAASVTGIPSLNIVTGTAVTAIISNHYALTNAAQTSVTLPASPSSGDLVWVTVENGLANNVIIRNGNKIKGLSENLVMDIANVGIQLRYVNANVGWTIN